MNQLQLFPFVEHFPDFGEEMGLILDNEQTTLTMILYCTFEIQQFSSVQKVWLSEHLQESKVKPIKIPLFLNNKKAKGFNGHLSIGNSYIHVP